MNSARAHRVHVEAWRGAVVESRHVVHVASWGTPSVARLECAAAELPTTWMRSTVKPLQLIPLLVAPGAAQLQLTAADLALLAASHDGTALHAERAGAILERAGLRTEWLRCGLHRPYFLDRLALDTPPHARLYDSLHHNCSGNHIAMLALARLHDVSPEGYLEPSSPHQQSIHALVEAASGVAPQLGTDNCGAPCYALPLAAIATLYRVFAAPGALSSLPQEHRQLVERLAPLDALEVACDRIGAAMAEQPQWLSGEDTGATRLARQLPGLVVKHGAEGVLCVARRDTGAVAAFKVADGNSRAVIPALVHMATTWGWLHAAARQSLEDLATPPVWGHAGQQVGRLQVAP